MRVIEKVLLVRIGSLILEKVTHPHQFYPPFLLKYIQGFLEREKNYQTKIIDCYVKAVSLDSLLEITFAYSADIIILYITSLNAEPALRYANLVKARDKSVVLVGVGPDITLNFQNYINSNLDFILQGEVERKVVSLIKDLGKEDYAMVLKGYDGRQTPELALVYDIDNLPFPQYSLDELLSYTFFYPIKTDRSLIWGHLLGNRGCSHNCIFCAQNTKETFSRQVRIRSAVSVVDEIEHLLRSGANFISFADDDFTISNDFIHSFCDEVKKRRLNFSWTAQARIDEVDCSLLQKMREVGCSLLAFGVESGSKRIMDILHKNDRGINWISTAKEVFKDCRRIGIATVALFIIGSPTETEKEVNMSVGLAKELDPDIIQVHFFTLYPGSYAYRQYRHKINSNLTLYHYAKPSVNISGMSLESLTIMQISFYRKFLLRPQFILRHLFKYCSFYLHNKSVFMILLKKTWMLVSGRLE